MLGSYAFSCCEHTATSLSGVQKRYALLPVWREAIVMAQHSAACVEFPVIAHLE
jgi:hypothetical protein